MDIKLTSTVILKDVNWGFSDLLNGRLLDKRTKLEIIDLIMEDWDDLADPKNWKVEEVIYKEKNEK